MNVVPKTIYCPSCGVESDSYNNFCRNCGTFLKNSDSLQVKKGLKFGDQALIFLANGFLTPIIGIILYFMWKYSAPRKAKEVGKLTWGGFILWLVIRVSVAIMLLNAIGKIVL